MTKKYQRENAPSPEQIQEEMGKIGALTHQPFPSSRNPWSKGGRRERQFSRSTKPTKPKKPRADCGGCCNGGDIFEVEIPDADCTNWIKFTAHYSDKVFEYESKATGTYEMDFEGANQTFDVSFTSTCENFENDVDTRVENGGKRLCLEDNEDYDYTDLIINCTEGHFHGRYSKDEKTLTYTSGSNTADNCGDGCECIDGQCTSPAEPDPDPDPEPEPQPECTTDDECPPGQICQDGVCVDGDRGCSDDSDCPPGQICVNGSCQDACPKTSEVWDGEKCVCANGYVLVDGECQEQCDPFPPVGGDGDCDDEGDPCFGVTCIPPRECVDGSCECPEGTRDAGNGLCMPADLCWGVLCPPNATCVDGICQCDDGYVLDGETGYCVMSETPDCLIEPEDCCPSNATIQIKPGRGLGGGGSFRLNQPCDKTIMLWVDSSGDDVADEECDEYGQAQVCSCSAEIAMLMDLIVELRAELEIIKDQAEICAEKNECIGSPGDGGGGGGGGGGGAHNEDFQCGDTPAGCAPINVISHMYTDEGNDRYTHDWGGAPEITDMKVINQEDEQNHRIVVTFASCLPSIAENYCITGLKTARGGTIDHCTKADMTKKGDSTYEYFFYGTIDQSEVGGVEEIGKSFVPADWTFYCCEGGGGEGSDDGGGGDQPETPERPDRPTK